VALIDLELVRSSFQKSTRLHTTVRRLAKKWGNNWTAVTSVACHLQLFESYSRTTFTLIILLQQYQRTMHATYFLLVCGLPALIALDRVSRVQIGLGGMLV
jgi:hypothetical protein